MELERIYRVSKKLEQIRIFLVNMSLIEEDYFKGDILKKQSIPAFLPLVNDLLKDLKFLNLSEVTKEELETCIEDIGSLLKKYKQEKGKKDDKKRDTEIRNKWNKTFGNYLAELIPKVLIWEDRILGELTKRQVIELYTNTLVNPNMLVEGAVSFFDLRIWNKMPDIQKNDLNDGCKCLLLEVWTPAAMIIIRSVESGLRYYYQMITSNNPSGRNWGTIINELKSNNSTDKKVLSYFEYLRDYRNQLQHPDARFDQSDAEDVLTQAIHILKRIYS